MTILNAEIMAIAPDVPSKAQEMTSQMRTVSSKYISLQSLQALCRGNETLDDLLREVAVYSLRYAETVCRFEQIVMRGQESNENETRAEIEKVRTSIHDATIASINCLSRTMKKNNVDNEWIKPLVQGGRSAYGKFAILLAFEVVLGERSA